jgi:hypothetical protein
MTTKSEKKYMNRVAELPCVLCGEHGVQVHHVREGQGMAQRSQNWLTVALCPECHTGSTGFHGNRNRLRLAKLDEMDLLALTIEKLNT